MNGKFTTNLLALLFLITAHCGAQTPVLNAVFWGTYFNDEEHFPDYDYTNTDLIDQVAVDFSTGSIYVVGQSLAPPTSITTLCSPTDSVFLGGGNGYLAKFNRCGDLIWSTYLGEKALCLTLSRESGKTIIYVAGNIQSPGEPGPPAFACDGDPTPIFQQYKTDLSDVFIAKYEDEGSSVSMLRWTYFGGTKPDALSGGETVYCMEQYKGKIFLVGSTTSIDLHHGAEHTYDSTKAEGSDDGFIAKFDSLLSRLEFFTYVGVDGTDRFHDLKILKSGNHAGALYASGTTTSSTEIASGNGFDQQYHAFDDAFVQKWEDKNLDGIYTPTWGTYIGGNSDEHSRVSQIDRAGNIIITGWSRSNDLPVTANAYDTLFGADGSADEVGDAYIIKVGGGGKNIWCTYLGGSKDDRSNGLATFRYQGKQVVAVTGTTQSLSDDFPLVNPLQNLLNGNDVSNQLEDGYLAILEDVSSSPQHLIQSTYIGGTEDEGIQTGKSYHPSITMGKNKEIYLVMSTKSDDIAATMGGEFKHLVDSFTGGADAFLAAFVDSNNTLQTNCNFLKPDPWATEQIDDEFDVYPNPFEREVYITFYSVTPGAFSVEVRNTMQQIQFRSTISAEEGENDLSINLENLSAGIYFITLQSDDRHVVRKLVRR